MQWFHKFLFRSLQWKGRCSIQHCKDFLEQLYQWKNIPYYIPFKGMISAFQPPPQALSQDYGRFILEEVLLLSPGYQFMFLICWKHSIISSHNPKLKSFRKTSQKAMTFNSMESVLYGRNCYLSMTSTVHSNANYYNFNVSLKMKFVPVHYSIMFHDQKNQFTMYTSIW